MSSQNQPIKLFCRGCGQKLDVSELEPFTKIPCPECGIMIRIPKPFDRYWLEKICGIGGMSKVYRAIDPDHQRHVAVKILDSEFHDEYRGGEQFVIESKLVAKIAHPGVIPVYDCGVWEHQPFLVMRYMSRGSLEAMQKNNILPDIPVLASWLHTIAEGLRAALEHDVLHHDIKPGNILIDSDGNAGLGDFDLADVRQGIESRMTATGWASPAYVSPERLQSGNEDWQGDLFSLGVTAYELMTGELPFGNTGETEDLLNRRRAQCPIDPHELNPRLSRSFCDLVLRMLSFSPNSRPTYDEVIQGFGREANLMRASFSDRLKEWLFHRRH